MNFWDTGSATAEGLRQATSALLRHARLSARLCARRSKRQSREAAHWLRAFYAAPSAEQPAPRLSLWFGVLGLICILLTSMASAALLSRSMTNTWIDQYERTLSDFVRSAVIAHDAAPLFEGRDPESEISRELDLMFRAFAGSDPVFLAHFYTPSGRIFWSSDPMFVGRSFEANDELGAALNGETVTEIGELSEAEKPEHALLDASRLFFVETYIPIFKDDPRPIGVVEIYRTPQHLKNAIDHSSSLIWTSSLLGGLALYLTLGWIARWGDRRLESSTRALAEANSLAAIGEVATAVAHGLRNPMAAMRSSAELALDAPTAGASGAQTAVDAQKEYRAALKQVVIQVDRLDQWVGALVGCLRTEMLNLESCDAGALLFECAEHVKRRAENAGLTLQADISRQPLPISANRTALQQVLECLIDNAVEATPRGGSVTLSAEPNSTLDEVVIEVRDTGPGVDHRIDPFALFLSTKGGGLGVGLPIARRLARRHGGSLTLTSAQPGGAVARLRLPLQSN